MTSETIGSFVKRVRQERGIRLADLSDVGASSMSRFENNQLDLSSSRLVGTFGLIGIDYRDLNIRHILPVTNEDDWQYLSPNYWDFGKVQWLRKSITSSQTATVKHSGYQQMIIAIIDELIKVHAGKMTKISSALVKRLNDYFKRITVFSGVDIFILNAVVDYVEVDETVGWVLPKARAIIDGRVALVDADIRNQISTLLMISESAGNERRFRLMRDILATVKKLIALVPEQVSVAYNYSVNLALVNLLENNDDYSREAFAQVINATRLIFPESYYPYLRKYVLEQGWLKASELDTTKA